MTLRRLILITKAAISICKPTVLRQCKSRKLCLNRGPRRIAPPPPRPPCALPLIFARVYEHGGIAYKGGALKRPF